MRIKHGEQQRREKKFVEFVEAHPPFGGLNEGTLRPLIDEKNEEVRVIAIETIEKALESGKNPTNDRGDPMNQDQRLVCRMIGGKWTPVSEPIKHKEKRREVII